jgi:hypothetical protein
MSWKPEEKGFITSKERDFPLLHRIQVGSWFHPTSYPMGTWGILSGSKEGKASS